jgi:hypothetical protein
MVGGDKGIQNFGRRGLLEVLNLAEQKRRWEHNTEIGLREIGCEDLIWMKLAQDRVEWQTLVLTMLNVRVLLLQCQLVMCLGNSRSVSQVVLQKLSSKFHTVAPICNFRHKQGKVHTDSINLFIIIIISNFKHLITWSYSY